MIRPIYDWREKHYQCAVCGTHESVKYWIITNDGWIPVCNKCGLTIPEGTTQVLRSEEQMKVYVVYRETCCQNDFIDKRLVAIFSKEEYAITYCERQAVGLDAYWYDVEYVDSEVEE